MIQNWLLSDFFTFLCTNIESPVSRNYPNIVFVSRRLQQTDEDVTAKYLHGCLVTYTTNWTLFVPCITAPKTFFCFAKMSIFISWNVLYRNRNLQCVNSWAKVRKKKKNSEGCWILQNCKPHPHPGLSWVFFPWILKWYTCNHQRSCILHQRLSLPCYCMEIPGGKPVVPMQDWGHVVRFLHWEVQRNRRKMTSARRDSDWGQKKKKKSYTTFSSTAQ